MGSHQTSLPKDTELDGIYRIEALLGSGGFGKTYRVYDQQLNRRLAIKEYFPVEAAARIGLEVHPSAEGNRDAFERGLERFNHEARHLAKLQHRNIVKVFRSFDANCTSYIVLEYVEGSDLEDWLTDLGRPPTQGELDKLSTLLLSSLAAVHAAELVHRDVQPKNIRIRSRDGEPVLLDFGIAKSVGTLDARGQSTVIVAHGYAPTESYTSKMKFLGPWTDIYGLAGVLYRAVSGNAPPPSPDRLHEDQMPPAVSLPVKESYRTSFLGAIDWGLRLDRNARPQTTGEWHGALLGNQTEPKAKKTPGTQPSSAPVEGAADKEQPSQPRTESSGISKTGFAVGVALLLAGAAILGTAFLATGKIEELIGIQQDASTTIEAESASKAAEDAKRAKDADDARKAAEDARQAKDAEDARKAAEDAKRAKDTEDVRKAADDARQAKDAEDARKAADDARRTKDAEDARKAADDAMRIKDAEDARKAVEDARRTKDTEDARKAADDARRTKDAEDARKAADIARRAKGAENARKAAAARRANAARALADKENTRKPQRRAPIPPQKTGRAQPTGDGEAARPARAPNSGNSQQPAMIHGIQ